jgi:mono/diheme cytochrome c family protein
VQAELSGAQRGEAIGHQAYGVGQHAALIREDVRIMAAQFIGMRRRLCAALVIAGVVGACTQEPTPSEKVAGEGDPRRGERIYLAQCTACHHRDPAKDGPLGPAVKGSSRELLEARVLRASYPPGYVPKRPSTIMPAQPHLEPDIPDLAAFLR